MLGWLAVWAALVWALRRRARVRLLPRRAPARALDLSALPRLRAGARVHRTLDGVAPYDRVEFGGHRLTVLPWTTVAHLRAWLRR
jgi:hypothetical protein